MKPIWMFAVPLVVLSGCASVDAEVGHLAFAASTPMRDLNIANPPIPNRLQALSHPYGHAGPPSCEGWHAEVAALQRSIVENEGRRVGFRRDSRTTEGRHGNLRDSGVKYATTLLLPFRGMVRQVSGSAKLEQEAERASDRARYRIGYLVGQARAAGCPGFQPRPPVRALRPAHPPAAFPPGASTPRGTAPRR